MSWQQNLVIMTELIKALTPLAWPMLAIFALIKFSPHLSSILSKEEGKIEFGPFKLSYGEAAERLKAQIEDLQNQIIKLDKAAGGNSAKDEIERFEEIKNGGDKCILWVDDFPSNNALLIDRFTKQGVDVTISVSTEDALRKIDSYDFDAVLSDLGRVEGGEDRPMAGLELVELIRKRNENVPILIYAGQRGLSHRDRLRSAGATDVTASPTQVIEFIENIRT